ncbi:MAG: HD domain-containing protein [Candidatus Neomarinimicrobiota bacterium]
MSSSDRLDAVKNLQLKYDPEPFHSAQVAKLALQLFDGLLSLHGLSASERTLLEAAALLHDIGYARENDDGHHKNSLKMILENNLPDFSPTENTIIANVARYHRKSLPSENHRQYAALPSDAATIVRKLAALLRIADGLDRSHRSLVYEIKTIIEPRKVIFKIYHYGELRNEIAAAEKKADLFKTEFGLEAKLRPHYLIQSNGSAGI